MTEHIINGKLFVTLSAYDIEDLINKRLFGKNGCSPDCEIHCVGAEVIIPLTSNAKCD